ncbi:MAG: hypothetical protein C0595_02995, partial [Marinilabiliales bacterium]
MKEEESNMHKISELQARIKELEKNEIYYKKIEEELESANQLLAETGSLAKVGGWEIDLKTNAVLWTEETKKIHEVDSDYIPTLEEAIDFFYGDSRDIIKNAVNIALKKGIQYDLDLELITKKGNRKFVHSVGYPLFKDGKCIRLSGIFQDITTRKKLEETIMKTKRFLQETEKIGKVGGWQFNPETLEQTWSEEIFRILEYDNFDKAPPVPKGIDFIDEEFRPIANKAIEEAITQGKSYDHIWRITTVKGNKKWVRAVAKPTIVSGKIINIIGSFHDITKLKEKEEELKATNQQLSASEQQLRATNQQLESSEQQLRASNEELLANEQQSKAINQQLVASEQQLRASNEELLANEQQIQAINQQLIASEQQQRNTNKELIKSQKEILKTSKRAESYLNIVAQIVLSLDNKGNITLINDSGLELLGYSKEELIGKNWFEMCLPENHRDEVKEVFMKLMKGDTNLVKFYESEIITSKGKIHKLHWHNTVLKDSNDNIIGTLSSAEDLTELLSKEEKLREANKNLVLAQNIAKLGYWTFNIETQTPSWTDEIFKMYDLPIEKGEPNYESQKKLVHPEDWEYFNTAVQKLINEQIPYDVQYRIVNRKGEIVWLRSKGLLNNDKTELYGIVQDITDLKSYEIKFKEQQNLLEKIFNTITDGIVITDEKRNIKFINKGLSELSGYSEEELIGKKTKVIYESENIYNEIGELISNDSPEILKNFYIKSYKKKDGKVFSGETFASKLYDSQGKWIGNLGIIRDISERLNFIQELNTAKEKAIENEEKYKALYENAPLSYQSLDEEGRFLDVNPTWLSTLGYQREEVIGNYYKDFLHPQWKEHFEENFPKFKKRGYVHDVGFKIKHKNGHYIDISFEGCIGYNSDGSFKQTYCVFQDVTERNLAVDNLLKNQYYLSKAQEIGKIGTWEIDLLINEINWTEETYKIFGIPQGQPMNYNTFLNSVHPEDRDYVNKQWSKAIKNKVYDIEHRIIVDGDVKWIKQKSEFECDNKGNAIKAIGFTQDITFNKEVENELLIAKERAEESDRLKSAFLANMSHEIRTPMNGILGFTNLLKTPDLKNEIQAKYVDIIQKSGLRMLNTVNDIIEISRIDSNLTTISTSSININSTINSLIEFFKPEAEKKDIKLIMGCNLKDTDVNIKTDENKFSSIITNLIKNAIKFTEKGIIELNCTKENDKLHFSLKDTGIGIPKKRQKAIFERFVQADI